MKSVSHAKFKDLQDERFKSHVMLALLSFYNFFCKIFFFPLPGFFLENSCSHSSTESLLQEWTWICLSVNHPESLLSDSSFTQGSLECLCHSQYAGSVSILSGMCFTMTVSSKKLFFFCPRLVKGLMIECSSAEVQ